MGSGVEREAGGGTEFVDEAFVLGELGGWLTEGEGVSGHAREVLEELKEGTPAEREAVLALAPLVVHVLARGNHGERGALERALEGSAREEIPEDPEEMSDELFFELEVENLVRLWDRYRWIGERSLSGPELRERLGGVSRQRLEQLRKSRRLFG